MAGYAFVSRWRVAATPDECWARVLAMLNPDEPSWWPGVRASGPAAPAAGDTVRLAVRSPLGYVLRVRLRITELVSRERLAATSEGDLRGGGRIDLAPSVDGTTLTTTWTVTTERRWMNLAAPILRPVFVLAHTVVMRRGERALRRAVAASGASRSSGP